MATETLTADGGHGEAWRAQTLTMLSGVTELLDDALALGDSGDSHQRICFQAGEGITRLLSMLDEPEAEPGSVLDRVYDLHSLIEGAAAVSSATAGTKAICTAALGLLDGASAFLDVVPGKH